MFSRLLIESGIVEWRKLDILDKTQLSMIILEAERQRKTEKDRGYQSSNRKSTEIPYSKLISKTIVGMRFAAMVTTKKTNESVILDIGVTLKILSSP